MRRGRGAAGRLAEPARLWSVALVLLLAGQGELWQVAERARQVALEAAQGWSRVVVAVGRGRGVEVEVAEGRPAGARLVRREGMEGSLADGGLVGRILRLGGRGRLVVGIMGHGLPAASAAGGWGLQWRIGGLLRDDVAGDWLTARELEAALDGVQVEGVVVQACWSGTMDVAWACRRARWAVLGCGRLEARPEVWWEVARGARPREVAEAMGAAVVVDGRRAREGAEVLGRLASSLAGGGEGARVVVEMAAALAGRKGPGGELVDVEGFARQLGALSSAQGVVDGSRALLGWAQRAVVHRSGGGTLKIYVPRLVGTGVEAYRRASGLGEVSGWAEALERLMVAPVWQVAG